MGAASGSGLATGIDSANGRSAVEATSMGRVGILGGVDSGGCGRGASQPVAGASGPVVAMGSNRSWR